MSRIGNKPIIIPDGVLVQYNSPLIKVQGKLGTLEMVANPSYPLVIDGNKITVSRNSETKKTKSEHGRINAGISNMINGVSVGWKKRLEMVGTGYRGRIEGNKLILSLGYSHPIEVIPPQGVEFQMEGQNVIIISGQDKQKVGQIAANIRSARPPEPYKGKGVKYAGEFIRRKAGKAAK